MNQTILAAIAVFVVLALVIWFFVLVGPGERKGYWETDFDDVPVPPGSADTSI